jgi:hypothetical protein
MPNFCKTLVSCLMALAITITSFVTSAEASSINILASSNSNLALMTSIPTQTIGKASRIVLKVTPKLANKLVKKYGSKIIKVIPAVGTALTVIEITTDIYQEFAQEFEREAQFKSQV